MKLPDYNNVYKNEILIQKYEDNIFCHELRNRKR